MHKLLRGQSLVEILLAIGVFMIAIVTLSVLALDGITTQRLAQERGVALQLAQEGLDATRSIRDASFSDLTTGDHGIVQSAGRWIFSGTSDVLGGYTRVINISSPDAFHRYVSSTVSWSFSSGRTSSVTLTTLFADWRTGTGAPPSSLVPLGSLNLAGAVAADAVAVSGTLAYVGRLTSSQQDFVVIDVSSSTNPILKGGYENGDTVTAVALSGTYAYLGGTANTVEIRVLNVSSSTNPTSVTTINLSGNGNTTGLYVSGTRLYVTRDAASKSPTFHVFDISNPAAPTELGSLNLGDGAGGSVISIGGTPYAFIAGRLSNQEFQVVNASSPAAMLVGGSVNIGGTEDMKRTAVSGTTAYGGSLLRATAGEFFTFNVSNPLSPSNLGSLEIGANVNAIQANEERTIIMLGTASSVAEGILISATDPAVPRMVTTLNLSGTVNDLAILDDIAYLATADTALEFQIIDLR